MTESRIPDEETRLEAAHKAFDKVISYIGGSLFQRMLADAEADKCQGADGSQFEIGARQLGADNPAMTLAIRPGEGIDFAVGDGNMHYLDMGQVLANMPQPSEPQ